MTEHDCIALIQQLTEICEAILQEQEDVLQSREALRSKARCIDEKHKILAEMIQDLISDLYGFNKKAGAFLHIRTDLAMIILELERMQKRTKRSPVQQEARKFFYALLETMPQV
jgi:FtsZ-binding cell division protein ZapB